MLSELDFLQLATAAVEESKYAGINLSWNKAKKRVSAYMQRYSEVYEEEYDKELKRLLSENMGEDEAHALAHDYASDIARYAALETEERY